MLGQEAFGNTDIVPGYSSFLFNQLLQRQFYNPNTLTINNINYNGNHHTTPVIYSSSVIATPAYPNNQYKNISIENVNINNTNNSNNTQIINHRSNGTTATTSITSSDRNKKIKISSVTSSPTLTTHYQSALFNQLLSSYQSPKESNNDNTIARPISIYPELDLLEIFGERELVARNRQRLKELLFSKKCNFGMPLYYIQLHQYITTRHQLSSITNMSPK